MLVVDDDAAVARSIARVLGGSCEVTQTTSPKVALERIRAGERFSVIAVDLNMTEMSGIELHALLLRELPEQAHRVVLITGDDVLPTNSIPSDRVLTKPVAVTELRALVARLVATLP